MKFATPSPVPSALDIHRDSRQKITNNAPKTPRVKTAVTFEVSDLPSTRAASAAVRPAFKPFPPILKDHKLNFVTSPKLTSMTAKVSKSRAAGQSKQLQAADVMDDIATVLQDITEVCSYTYHCGFGELISTTLGSSA